VCAKCHKCLARLREIGSFPEPSEPVQQPAG
jgi:hypothetical protein